MNDSMKDADARPAALFSGDDFPLSMLPLSTMSAQLLKAENSLNDLPQMLNQFWPALEQGKTLAELKGVDAQELEQQYALAYDLCQQEQWSDALPLLLNLVAHDPMRPEWHFAAGMCFQQTNEIQMACMCYAQAMLLDPEDAACAFRLGECLLADGQAQGAITAFQCALELIQANYDQFHHLLAPTEACLQELQAQDIQPGAARG